MCICLYSSCMCATMCIHQAASPESVRKAALPSSKTIWAPKLGAHHHHSLQEAVHRPLGGRVRCMHELAVLRLHAHLINSAHAGVRSLRGQVHGRAPHPDNSDQLGARKCPEHARLYTQETVHKPLGGEVKCMDVSPILEGRTGAPFLAVGMADASVRIFSLGAEDMLEPRATQV